MIFLRDLEKVISDFQSYDMYMKLAMVTDPENPYLDKTINKIFEIIEASMVNFEILEIQSNEYKTIINGLKMKEMYDFYFCLKSVETSCSKDDFLQLMCLHSSLLDCHTLIESLKKDIDKF